MAADQTLVSPKQAARAMGVSESSLKRWCDSGLLQVVRTVGGHRKIAIGEVIRFANQNGTTLVAPAEFSLSITRENPASRLSDSPLRLADALLSGNESATRQILMDLFLENVGISTLCDEVIAPAFHEIGKRWSCQAANIYQERRGCGMIIRVLHEFHRLTPSVDTERVALGGTLSGDLYEIPTSMAELVLQFSGYNAQNLGTSIPASEFAQAIRDLRPQLFWLSVSHIADETGFVEEMANLSTSCMEVGTSLVIGGREVNEKLRPRLTYSAYCDTMKHLENFARDIKRWSSRPKAPSRSTRTGRKSLRQPMRPNALRRKRVN